MCGKDTSTLHRAMKAGRLSYSTDSQGRRQLDPAELARVFDLDPAHGNGAMHSTAAPRAPHGTQPTAETAAMQRLIEDQAETIRDLRQRLDASEDERRALADKFSGLLERRPAGSVPTVIPRRRWWHWR